MPLKKEIPKFKQLSLSYCKPKRSNTTPIANEMPRHTNIGHLALIFLLIIDNLEFWHLSFLPTTFTSSLSISSPFRFVMFHLAGLGGEQFVEFGILREVIRKGQNDVIEEQQSVARLGVGHIGKLFRRNV